MKILVAEDEPLILRLIEMCLVQGGYEVIKAINGLEAFDKIKPYRPDLILTDLMMPQMSGFELLEEVKVKLKISTPMVVLSSLDDEESMSRATLLGASDYIIKPFIRSDLLTRVGKLLTVNPY
ncbi:MAG: response regulator [Ginsengibacter sp.]|jgi:DNA-binding response OmpR family regulator